MPDKGNIELLLEKKLIDSRQLEEAKNEAGKTGMSIEQALEKLGFVTKEKIAQTVAEEIGVPFMDLSDYLVDPQVLKLIPEAIAKKYKVAPLFKIGNSLTVAMVDPQNIIVLDQIRKVSKIDSIEAVLALEEGVDKVLDSYYGVTGAVDELIDAIDQQQIKIDEKLDLSQLAEEAPVIKLVNIMLMKAAKDRASDIHVEPEENLTRVRNRIDGILNEAYTLPNNLHKAIVSRIKLLAGMDIAESRKPQDGRIRIKLENKALDIRVSSFPTIYGENIVMRLLDKSSVIFGLEELGFLKEGLEVFDNIIHRSNGIFLVTGPTGSGKTTTLYAALTTINSMEKNIITIEDPVEYELPLIRQTQVNPKAGITFANGLRAILRQDPDIIMVGEIRDKETADVAIRAALTGHLVFSTLHTNDAPSALTRLIDMGIEPFLVSSSVVGILAQRLLRVNCQKCKEKYDPQKAVLKNLGITDKNDFYIGKGCKACKKTGFRGRVGIFELLVLNEELKKMINEKQSADQIRQKAIELGMRTLGQDGIEKVKKGLVSPDEVVRVTQVE